MTGSVDVKELNSIHRRLDQKSSVETAGLNLFFENTKEPLMTIHKTEDHRVIL